MKQKWFNIVNYPLRSYPKFIEFTTKEGTECSTPFTQDMQDLVEGLEGSEVSPFSEKNFRQLFKEV